MPLETVDTDTPFDPGPEPHTLWLVSDGLLDIWQRDGFLRTREGKRLDITHLERNPDGSFTPTFTTSDDGYAMVRASYLEERA